MIVTGSRDNMVSHRTFWSGPNDELAQSTLRFTFCLLDSQVRVWDPHSIGNTEEEPHFMLTQHTNFVSPATVDLASQPTVSS